MKHQNGKILYAVRGELMVAAAGGRMLMVIAR